MQDTNFPTPSQSEDGAVATAVFVPRWKAVEPQTVRRLGTWIDGWADTVEGRASQVNDVVRTFTVEALPHLKATMTPQMGSIGVDGMSALAKGTTRPLIPKKIGATLAAGAKAAPEVFPTMFGQSPADKQHQYQYFQLNPGINMIVKIATTGQDLFVSWDLYAKRSWNEVILGLVILSSAVIGFLSALFFGNHTGLFPFIFGFILSFIKWLFGISAVITFVGYLSRRNLFLKELDLFEYHDIEAMLLVVHKAILKSLQSIGVDTSKLRAKEQYKAGQKDRSV